MCHPSCRDLGKTKARAQTRFCKSNSTSVLTYFQFPTEGSLSTTLSCEQDKTRKKKKNPMPSSEHSHFSCFQSLSICHQPLPASHTGCRFQSSLSRPVSTVTICYLFCLLHDLSNAFSDRLHDKVPNVIILHIFLKARDQE